MSFYRQWAAAGMNKKIPMASTTLGVGNEHVVLTPEEGNGILVAYNYSKENAIPENKAFLNRWNAKFGNTDDIHEIAVSNYQGIKLWAEAVNRANTHDDRERLIATLESGLGIDGPTGRVTIDGQTHHAILDVHILEVREQKLEIVKSFAQRQPIDTQTVCNLKLNPNDTNQYEITI